MRIGLLGPVELVVDDHPVAIPGAGERALLTMLALDAGRIVSAERLIDGLWGESLPANPANALQTRVSKLRKIVGDVVQTRPPGYVLIVDPDVVDVHRFRRLVATGLYGEALSLWRGPALDEFATTDWGAPLASRLDEERLTAVEQRLDVDLEEGRHADVIPELEALVAEHPLRERLRGQLMRALYRAGRQADALAVYQDARQVLTEELGLDPDPELQRLEAAILRQDPALGGVPPGAVPVTVRVPARITEVVGRGDDLDRCMELLANHRLITVTGPGGSGKTTLAVELAHRVRDEHPDGVWFVPLAELTEPQRIADVVLAELEVVSPDAPSARDVLASYLAGRRALLVLDNCEHLADAAAALAHHLLRASSALRIVATSRSALGISGEVQVPLPPLAADEAVALFTARASAVSPAFALGDAGPTVAEICERLDRMPLAIELAAVRARSMPVAQIAQRLDDRFALLATGPRTAEARHRTLQATVDWSHELLDEAERMLFRRLAVFAGSWSLDDAEAVCADETLPRYAVLDVLDRLVGHSLVVADAGRFRMLETIRVYADHRLAASPDAEALATRHARHFTELAERAERGLRGGEQLQWLALLRASDANLRAALAWSRTHAHDDPDALLRLAASLAWFWFVGRHREGREELTAALAAAEGASPIARGRALQALSIVQRPGGCIVHPSSRAHEPAVQSLEIFTHMGDRHRALISTVLASMEAVGGVDVDETLTTLAHAARDLAALGDEWTAALAEFVALEIHAQQRSVDDAVALAERVVERFRRIGDRWGTSAVLSHIGQRLRLAGRRAEARASLEEALAQSVAAGLHNTVAGTLIDLAALALYDGDADTADAFVADAMPLADEIGNVLYRALGAQVRATTAYLRGDIPTADRLAEEALDTLRADGVPAAALSMALLAMCAVRDGRVTAAGSYAEEALTTAVAAHNAGLEARAREALAAVRVTQGDMAAAAQLLREAVYLRAQHTRPTDAVEAADVQWTAEQCREHLALEELAALPCPPVNWGGAQATS